MKKKKSDLRFLFTYIILHYFYYLYGYIIMLKEITLRVLYTCRVYTIEVKICANYGHVGVKTSLVNKEGC